MTRINLLNPKFLADQHLLAEYRELPMVLGSLNRSILSKKGVNFEEIPKDFTLNKGHVYFFYDKLNYLKERYLSLIDELSNRGYALNPQDRNVDFKRFHNRFHGQYKPTRKDKGIIAERIILRIGQKPDFYTYYGKPLDTKYFTKLEKYL